MNAVGTCFLFILIFTLIELNQCGRYGGGRSSSSRSSSSRTTYSRPGGSRPAPAPTARRPSPQYSHPRPTPSRVATTRRPIPTSPHRTTPRPHYDTVPRVTSNPLNQAPTPRRTTPRTHQEQIPRVTSKPLNRAPIPPPQHPTQRWGNTPRAPTPRHPPSTSRPYTMGYPTRAPGWDLPPAVRPHNYPQGPARQSYSNSYTPYQGPSKVKIVNKYKYYYPGYYSMPVYSSYPGYFHTPSVYHYSSHDTGSTALGFFLGYGLARLTTPTYSHHSFYDGYTPRYDHYTVHHYYHNRESIPAKQEIPANTIVGCVGDSQTVCPGNTISLCTSSGALMCVVSAAATNPCENNNQVNCVRSTISCVNSTAPECKNANQNTTINIPCISTAEIYGNLKYVDNTIIVDVPGNETDTNSTTTTPRYSTKYPITTTPLPETVASQTIVKGNDGPKNYCVTVVALPAKKEKTEGEKLFEDAKDIVSQFMENVWGL